MCPAPTLQQRLTSKSRFVRGFTLVEMLVAAVVGAVLIVLVAQMASSGLQSVGIAGGRMVSASKMHDLRGQLAADLALVPDPALGLPGSEPPLRLTVDDSGWRLALLQPGTQSAWKQVNYRWKRVPQVLERVEQPLGTATDRLEDRSPQTLVTGLIDWRVQCLADASQESGALEWNGAQHLPAALLCQATLSSVREQGPRERQQTAGESGRSYEWRLPVAGGGHTP